MPTISWNDIDTNINTKGYLDSAEVVNARKKGVDSVFVGMIQEDYESKIDTDKIIDKYDKGSYGRMPVYISPQQRSDIERLYREHVILKCKYNNLKAEFKKHCGILDEARSFFSQFGICKERKEYTEYQKKLTELNLKVIEKERELAETVDSYLYKPVYNTSKGESLELTFHTPIAYAEY